MKGVGTVLLCKPDADTSLLAILKAATTNQGHTVAALFRHGRICVALHSLNPNPSVGAKLGSVTISALGRGLKQEGIGHMTFRVPLPTSRSIPWARKRQAVNVRRLEIEAISSRLKSDVQAIPKVSGDLLSHFQTKTDGSLVNPP